MGGGWGTTGKRQRRVGSGTEATREAFPATRGAMEAGLQEVDGVRRLLLSDVSVVARVRSIGPSSIFFCVRWSLRIIARAIRRRVLIMLLSYRAVR
jgi:hypothetical protein